MPAIAAPPSPTRTRALTGLALAAFAGNSLLCRVALDRTSIDPASFTALRLATGAVAVLGGIALTLPWRTRALASH